jgi:hypothetical protein
MKSRSSMSAVMAGLAFVCAGSCPNAASASAGTAASPIVGETAFVGGNSGGGGNARVCFNSPATLSAVKDAIVANDGYIPDSYISPTYVVSVKMLDSVEGDAAQGGWDGQKIPPVDDIDPSASPTDDFNHLVSRFKILAPGLVSAIDYGAEALQTVKQADKGIERIDDINSRMIINDDRCLRITIIAQTDGDNGTYVLIDPRFFNLSEPVFSNFEKAVARLHEFLYHEARTRGDTNSDRTRELVGVMIKKDILLSDLPHVGTYLDSLAGTLEYQFTTSPPSGFHLDQTFFESDEKFKARCQLAAGQYNAAVAKWYADQGRSALSQFKGVLPDSVFEGIDQSFQSKIGFNFSYHIDTNRVAISMFDHNYCEPDGDISDVLDILVGHSEFLHVPIAN